MMEMDGDWCEERPTLIDSYGWALNPECFYLKLPKAMLLALHGDEGIGGTKMQGLSAGPIGWLAANPTHSTIPHYASAPP